MIRPQGADMNRMSVAATPEPCPERMLRTSFSFHGGAWGFVVPSPCRVKTLQKTISLAACKISAGHVSGLQAAFDLKRFHINPDGQRVVTPAQYNAASA